MKMSRFRAVATTAFISAVVVSTLSVSTLSASRAMTTNHDAPHTPSPSPTPSPTPKPKPKSAPVTFSLRADKKTYRVGETVNFTMVARNVSKTVQPLTFGSGQSFDVIARDSKGQVVWQWARGKFFTMSVREEELEKGKTMVFGAVWSREAGQNAPAPGVYKIEAKLKSIEQKLTAATQITVKAPGEK